MDAAERARRRQVVTRLRAAAAQLELELDPTLTRATVPPAIVTKILVAQRTLREAAKDLDRSQRRTTRKAAATKAD